MSPADAGPDQGRPDAQRAPDGELGTDGTPDGGAGCEGPSPGGGAAECATDEDCGGGRCITEDCCRCEAGGWRCAPGCVRARCEAPPACGPDPAGCAADGDCPEGEICRPDPECPPTGCVCVEGAWRCDAACGGRCGPPEGCAGENPQGCGGDADCSPDQRCEVDPAGCRSSGCACLEGVWSCLPDCGGGICTPRVACPAPSPQGCRRDRDCGAGARCVADAACRPSVCECVEGGWRCSEDCGGGRCEADGPCGPNPAGCTQAGCPPGQQCVRDPGQCAPSSCRCDAESGAWACTRDCGGGGVCR